MSGGGSSSAPPPTTMILGPGNDDNDPQVFDWERRASSHWRLALTILLSLLAHAFAFYILQVAYTPTASQVPPPAQVIIVPPGAPGAAALERWIEVADPALMTQPSALPLDHIMETIGFHYVPSYATVLQAFKPLPAQNDVEAPPSTRRTGPVPTGLLPPLEASADENAAYAATNSATQKAVGTPSALVLSSAIQELVDGGTSTLLLPVTQSSKPLDRTVFLVGVPAGGGAPWIFQQASSGDATEKGADASARDFLARLRFRAPAGSQQKSTPVWGTATFWWGRDAYP